MENSNWQLQLSAHRERCKYAFDNSLFCDVEFSVVDSDGNKVTVQANKYPLAVCSPVFEAMFYGNLAETKSPIHIADCTKEGLQEILRYAYYEEAKLTGSNVMEVLYLAKKYMIPSLEEQCQHYIQNDVVPEDVLSILPHIQTVCDQILENHFWDIVDDNTERVILSNSFLNVSREMLGKVLERDGLRVNELRLFEAVDKWVTKRIEEDKNLVCSGETKRVILGKDIIRLIRFPLMTNQEIAEVVLPCQILDISELTEMLSIFGGVTPKAEIFSSKKRSPYELLISNMRFGSDYLQSPKDDSLWSYNKGKKDWIQFSVNKAVRLVGVRLFGSEDKSYTVDLKIIKHESLECISHKASSSYDTEEQKIDGLYYGFTVTLDKSVRLEPGVMYSIEAKISGPCSWYGQSGYRYILAVDGINISYVNAYDYINRESNGTSVLDGQFPSIVLQNI